MKEMSFKSGVKGWGSDRRWERRWWLWWGDMHRMRWTRRSEQNEIDGMKKEADYQGCSPGLERLGLVSIPSLQSLGLVSASKVSFT